MWGKIFEAEMTVRDSELDQHGFVKDDVYACYIEKGWF
jgi:acyl-CoA thioesterase FadM